MGCCPISRSCDVYRETPRCGPIGGSCRVYQDTSGGTEVTNLCQMQPPNPARFEIVTVLQVGAHAVAKIRYPDCSNYEGLKVCLFKNTSEKLLREVTRLDPHFSKTPMSPFARFQPSHNGWNAAVNLAKLI